MLSLEQQGSKIPCPKYEHDKKPIISFCLFPKCKDNSLLCIKCKSQHEQHPNYIFTLPFLQEFLLRNCDITKAINNPLTTEIFEQFVKYKKLIIQKLQVIEEKLIKSLAQLNENQSIKEITQKCINLKTQLNYENFKQVSQQIQEQCTYDQNLKKLMSNEFIEKYEKGKAQFLSAINELQKLAQSVQQNCEIKKDIITTNKNNKSQFIKRYEMIAKDSDGTLTIKPFKVNKIYICNFLVEQTCELIGFTHPFLYKSKDLDYSNQNQKCVFRIHIGTDLSSTVHETFFQLNHSMNEKLANNCYVIKLSEQFRLIIGQVFTLSVSILDQDTFTFSFQNLSEINPYLKFQFPKVNQYKHPKTVFKEIDDFGYFPSLLIV